MNKYFYPIYKMKLKPWIKYWLLKRSSVKPVTGTYTLASGQSPLTITKALVAQIRDLNLYGDCYQVQRAGTNLYQGFSFSKIVSGVTFTYNVNGTIFANGTAGANCISMYSSEASSYLITLPAGTYTVSGTNLTSNIKAEVVKSNGTLVALTDGTLKKTFTLNEETSVFLRLNINSGTVVDNVTISPMINLGDEALPYEPYGYKPSPTNPSEVQTITGNTGITISEVDGFHFNYKPIRLGSIELCKIGDYSDRIYKSEEDNKWYLEKNIGKKVFTGDNSVDGTWSTQTGYYQCNAYLGSISSAGALCDHYTYGNLNTVNNFTITTNAFRVNDSTDTLANYKTWVSTHNIILYYVLATPVITEITNTNLLNDLESANQFETFKGTNEITFSDLSPNISFEYLKEDEV